MIATVQYTTLPYIVKDMYGGIVYILSYFLYPPYLISLILADLLSLRHAHNFELAHPKKERTIW